MLSSTPRSGPYVGPFTSGVPSIITDSFCRRPKCRWIFKITLAIRYSILRRRRSGENVSTTDSTHFRPERHSTPVRWACADQSQTMRDAVSECHHINAVCPCHVAVELELDLRVALFKGQTRSTSNLTTKWPCRLAYPQRSSGLSTAR